MKNLILLFAIALLKPVVSPAQSSDHYRNAIAGTVSGFLFSGTPYLATLGLAGLKYDYFFYNADNNYVPYLSTGLQLMTQDGDNNIAIPVEICFGSDRRIVSFHIGAGGILHSGGFYLQPAIFFTTHGNLRFKFGRLPIFLDLEARLLGHYAYEYVHGGSSGPVKRTGSSISPGLGFSVGAYF